MSVERAISTIKGIRFYQTMTGKAAKFMVRIVLLIIVGSCLHDPVHRRLFDERNDDENDDV